MPPLVGDPVEPMQLLVYGGPDGGGGCAVVTAAEKGQVLPDPVQGGGAHRLVDAVRVLTTRFVADAVDRQVATEASKRGLKA